MAVDWNTIELRLRQKFEDGTVPLAVTGIETDDELREIAQHIALLCPTHDHAVDCPFKLLRTLTTASQKTTLEKMPREQLLELFDLEHASRSQIVESAELVDLPHFPAAPGCGRNQINGANGSAAV